MLYYTHLLIGFLIFLLFKDYFHGGNELLFLVMILFSSLLPDIDEKNSKINRQSGIVGKVLTFFFKHRGIFHSVFLALLLFILTTIFWNNYYAWALFLGYLGHLLGDAVTLFGIQFFYPLFRFKIKGPIRVGGILEGILIGIILIVIIILIIKRIF